MTTHGQIGEFHGDLESRTSYVDQLECNFLANNVANAKNQGAILLSCSAYSLIQNLAGPSKPKDVTPNLEKVTAYFAPRCSRVVLRFKFNSCSQQTRESIATYVSGVTKNFLSIERL